MSRQRSMASKANAPDSLRRGKNIDLDIRINQLVQLMHARLDEGKPLNFSEPSHIAITEALHVLAYEKSDTGPPGVDSLKVSYGDNSKTQPLLVRCLSDPPDVQINTNDALNVGTLSFRHLDYDSYVDVYLIRDRETRSKSPNEIDKLAYERMNEILNDPFFEREGAQILIFQLAVGLYRAVIHHLCARRLKGMPTVAIQPKYYLGEREGRGLGSLWA